MILLTDQQSFFQPIGNLFLVSLISIVDWNIEGSFISKMSANKE